MKITAFVIFDVYRLFSSLLFESFFLPFITISHLSHTAASVNVDALCQQRYHRQEYQPSRPKTASQRPCVLDNRRRDETEKTQSASLCWETGSAESILVDKVVGKTTHTRYLPDTYSRDCLGTGS